MPGILASLPDLSATAQLTTSVSSGLDSLGGVLDGGMGHDQGGSPLAALTSAMQGLQGKLNIDVSGLTHDLPTALTTAKNAIPSSGLDFVSSLSAGYTSAGGFLGDLPLVKQIPAGGNLQDTALALVRAALDEFGSRQSSLASNLIDAAKLSVVNDTLASFERFRTDFATHQNDFLPFLAQNLVGVAPDLLHEPLAHVDGAFAAFAKLDAASVATALGAPRDALAGAVRTIVAAIDTFDPSDANAYAALRTALGTVTSAANALRDAVTPLYGDLRTAWDALDWNALFAHLAALLTRSRSPTCRCSPTRSARCAPSSKTS